MTYAIASALQEAVFTRLSGDAALISLIGNNVYDALPTSSLPPAYVLIGEETVTDRSSKTSAGARHVLTISVHSDLTGFSQAKEAGEAICDALIDADLALSRGNLVGLGFISAKAFRGETPELRRIDLRFRAFVEDT